MVAVIPRLPRVVARFAVPEADEKSVTLTMYTLAKCWTYVANDEAGDLHSLPFRWLLEILSKVMTFEDLKELEDEEAVKKAGKLRQQGKKYAVQDADVIFFKVREE